MMTVMQLFQVGAQDVGMQEAGVQEMSVKQAQLTRELYDAATLEVAVAFDAFVSLEELVPDLDWEDALVSAWGIPAIDPAPSQMSIAIDRSLKQVMQLLRSLKPLTALATGSNL
jgi:DNA-binding transcriptional regulator YdaS (Cro superfamily)